MTQMRRDFDRPGYQQVLACVQTRAGQFRKKYLDNAIILTEIAIVMTCVIRENDFYIISLIFTKTVKWLWRDFAGIINKQRYFLKSVEHDVYVINSVAQQYLT